MSDAPAENKDEGQEATEKEVTDAADKVVAALEPEAEKVEDAQEKVEEVLDEVIDADTKLQEEGAKEIEKATQGMSDEDVNRVADAVYAKLNPDMPVETVVEDVPDAVDDAPADDPVEPDEPPKNEHWYFRKRGKGDN